MRMILWTSELVLEACLLAPAAFFLSQISLSPLGVALRNEERHVVAYTY